jgi:hypothetical protein
MKAKKGFAAAAGAIVAGLAVTVARGGHELPVYPSYYPHEIAIATLSPERAGALMADDKLQAYVGAAPRFPGGAPPATVQTIVSLGDVVMVRVDPKLDGAAACDAVAAWARAAAQARDIVVHPFPVTPFNGDYLDFADLADAAKTRLLEAAPEGAADTVAVTRVDVAARIAAAGTATNGWRGPPWLRTGWFQADLLLGDTLDAATRQRVAPLRARLERGDYADLVERLNLERAVVTALAGSCRARVVGYTVRREAIDTEYSAGIENVGYDAIAGLDAPLFVRTVKLKDFPWNGWLALGVPEAPRAAWNPVAGFTDGFGRLVWSALGDPAVLPAPDDAGWSFNRIADVRVAP